MFSVLCYYGYMSSLTIKLLFIVKKGNNHIGYYNVICLYTFEYIKVISKRL